MTLAKVVEGFKAGFIKEKADLDDMTVTVKKANPPKEGEYGFSTMLTVSDDSDQDSVVFVDGQHTPPVGSTVLLHGVRFRRYEEKAKDKGPGVYKNLGITAKSMMPVGQSPSQPGSPAPAPSAGRESEGERRDSIEAQAVMKATANIVGSMYHGVMASNAYVDKTPALLARNEFDVLFDHLWAKLQATKKSAQPPVAQSAGASPVPGKAEGPGTFAEAAAAGAMLVKIVGDQAKARQAFTNLTGAKALSDCPDKGCADGWLTTITNIKRSFEKLTHDEDKTKFIETLVKPGMTPEERDAELENIVVGDALPF